MAAAVAAAAPVSTRGLFGDNALANLQRGFDFYSWLTFLALNSPADGSSIDKSSPNTPTKWEQPTNFKQLLDVMLPGGKSSKWEDKKIVPPECRDQYRSGGGGVLVSFFPAQPKSLGHCVLSNI
ncbi:MAG: hypothetical protein E6G77_21755 [Alphaproteobacteria bacterium]|nr:MAG: hypothetical protein E6G77_21755 [Alphaproteobacteria bacterium]